MVPRKSEKKLSGPPGNASGTARAAGKGIPAHDVAPLLQRGIECQRLGKYPEAEYFYQLVLRDYPEQPDALNLMGTLAVHAKRYELSIELLEKAVKISPKNVDYRNNLANSYIMADAPAKAMPHLRKAISLKPRFVEALLNIARAYRALNKAEEALKAYRRVLTFDPGNLPARTGCGDVCIDLGHMDEATAVFRGLLKEDPGSTHAIVGLATSHAFSPEDTEIGLFVAALDNNDLADAGRAAINDALGKVHSDIGRHDDAFRYYLEAKRLSGGDYSIEEYRTYVDKIIGLFSADFFAERNNFGHPSERPVFIVGMPRSGTSLTEQILASHPKVTGAGELVDIDEILLRITKDAPRTSDAYFNSLSELSKEYSKTEARAYLSTLDRHSRSALRVVDKMPHNFQGLGLISLMFPQARVIHCRRNPMDTCVSCFTHQFNDAHDYASDLTTLGLYFREYNRLMKHWTKTLNLKIFELNYEDMIEDQVRMSRELVDFLDLEWDDACLAFHETRRSVRTLSRWQVRQPIYRTSVERWRRYDSYLGPLKDALGDLFDDQSSNQSHPKALNDPAS